MLAAQANTNVAWGENRTFVFDARVDPHLLRRALDESLVRNADLNVCIVAVPGQPGRYAFAPVSGDSKPFRLTHTVVHDAELGLLLRESPAAVRTDKRFAQFYPPTSPGWGANVPLLLAALVVFEPHGVCFLSFTTSHGLCDAHSTFLLLRQVDLACQPRVAADAPRRLHVMTLHDDRLQQNLFAPARLAQLWPEPAARASARLAGIAACEAKGTLWAALSETHARQHLVLHGAALAKLRDELEGSDAVKRSINEVVFALVVGASLRAQGRAKAQADIQTTVVTNLRGRVPALTCDGASGQDALMGNLFAKPLTRLRLSPQTVDALLGPELGWLRLVSKDMHDHVRRGASDVGALERYLLCEEMMVREPDSLEFFDCGPTRLMESGGFILNSWRCRDWKWFELSFGAHQQPTHMTNTVGYESVVIPRLVFVIPCNGRGDLQVLTCLSHAENDCVATAARSLGLTG
jgi:hypothetical protein